jgi:hypothetical protein
MCDLQKSGNNRKIDTCSKAKKNQCITPDDCIDTVYYFFHFERIKGDFVRIWV